MKIKIFLFSILSLFATIGVAQDTLQKADAVAIAMENNFDIQITKNDIQIAANNASIQNSKYLPSVSGQAGANYANSSGTVTRSGVDYDIPNNETNGLNASIGIRYTVFDGFGRNNTYKKLQESYQISSLQAQQIVENTILSIFTSYYEIARLSQDVENQKESMYISRVRLKRANYNFEYGQGSKLDILNAEVDYNNDSITYLTNTQNLANQKRNLNLLLGRDVSVDFYVDTNIVYDESLTLDYLMSYAQENNITLQQQERLLNNAQYEIKSVNSNAIPKLDVNANYGWNLNNMGPASFIQQSEMVGPSLGATLSWNIYDGGSTRIRKQNAQILAETQSLNLEKERLNVTRNISNAWTAYQTALFVKTAQQKNLETAQTNFDRSVDQYKLGQISSIEFRQAQRNLLSAQLALNQAKYTAKNAELFLLQISGNLKQATF